ncbi:MAG TPA: methyltransferase domain-containing protein, partial [Acidobacteriota bacterium]|nr:methyltransferase domain-containing protein [Acidobacteriota bacterium]
MGRRSDTGQIDWATPCWREMLIYQREAMWIEGALERTALWLDLQPGMTTVDVGCGLGYLGYTYWPYVGTGGRYIGIDVSPALIRDARASATEWSTGGRACFAVSDAYHLPLPDDFADRVMCQTLLIHLENPADALKEMARVVKPGGLVVCHEPDNLSSLMPRYECSLPELTIDEELLVAKVYMLSNQGRIRLGRGDKRTGAKVPGLMHQAGLSGIGVRLNERVGFLAPPYDDERQQLTLVRLKKQWLDDERRRIWFEREREEFLAGGGDPAEYGRYLKIAEASLGALKQQLNAGEYSTCFSGDLYIARGVKPVS